jgi:threonine dehydrogenase-like Zn-dependent dehydrogenase
MKAITVVPGKAGSATLSEMGDPPAEEGDVLVEIVAVGICGTDLEIVSGQYGWAPKGEENLVLGHESIGRVLEPGDAPDLSPGDYVVGIVRRPDPVPCYNCAVGEWDFCRNGQYTEHGIKSLHGFMRERYRAPHEALVKVDPSLGELGVLLEPTSVVAKAWEQTFKVGGRSTWKPKVAVVTGAGPIGLLAALIGVQRGLEVHVFDQVVEGLKPELVAALGAHYHTGPIEQSVDEPDVVVECTGVPALVFDAIEHIGSGGVVCLTGVSPTGRELSIDAGLVNRSMVLANEGVVGSVNANKRHYEEAAASLAAARRDWLGRLITRKVRIDDFAQAFARQAEDVKVVLQVAPAA